MSLCFVELRVGSGERRAGSGERGVGSLERRAESGERRVGSGEWGVGSGELGAESGERRAESGERRAESGMTRFRFENLEIWQRAAKTARQLFRLADELERRKLYRFADQLRGSALSMTNNIAEGSGSTSKKEFVRYLDIARKSTFENASMILIFGQEGFVADPLMTTLLQELDELCRMITAFSRSLQQKANT